MAQKTLLVVVGPTGIGKTSLAVQLAAHFKTEILSADSRQFFKEMSIGTAVPTEEELKMVPHHFVHQISIHDYYTAGDFERDAIEKLDELFKLHDLVLMVGGSGLYIDAVVYGIDSFPKIKPGLRQELQKELEENGLKPLQEELKLKDPEYHEKVDLQNPQRVLRAIEVIRTSGHAFSDFLGKGKKKRPFRSVILGLEASREIVYERINARVDQMIKSGLLQEVEALKNYEDLNALQTVGYKELFSYLKGETDLEEAITEIKKNTRRFAKRQGTWFRKNKDIRWVPYDLPLEEYIKFVNKLIQDSKEVNTRRVFFVMGVSGSGKSTIGRKLANILSIPFHDGDDYHPEENVVKMSKGIPLNDEDRKSWLEALNSLAQKNLKTGAVIACSALKKQYRDTLSASILPPPIWIYLQGSYETILDRLKQRKDHFMPAKLLTSQFEALEAPEDAIEVPITLEPEKILEEILKQLK